MVPQLVDVLQGLAWMSRGESIPHLFALSDKAELWSLQTARRSRVSALTEDGKEVQDQG